MMSFVMMLMSFLMMGKYHLGWLGLEDAWFWLIEVLINLWTRVKLTVSLSQNSEVDAGIKKHHPVRFIVEYSP